MKHGRKATALFEQRGRTVIRIWECELKWKNRQALRKAELCVRSSIPKISSLRKTVRRIYFFLKSVCGENDFSSFPRSCSSRFPLCVLHAHFEKHKAEGAEYRKGNKDMPKLHRVCPHIGENAEPCHIKAGYKPHATGCRRQCALFYMVKAPLFT